ncbi:hypothetical protein LTR84_006586 [Exophiala bonariae]|uniref:Acyltransferase 3 domain-containing protein n=1 Tax=Exophiala bonariae TaxID=1690606 RepID=A0AAV9N0J0_9EURO|nr:hypothetical protein LTR84_006586 [Exophiala bonariae]
MAQYRTLDQLDLEPQRNNTGSGTNSEVPLPRWARFGDKVTPWSSPSTRSLVSALPRFLQPGGIKHRTIGPTSYLDALRGYAAVIVFISHAFNTEKLSWRNQPLIGLFFQGTGMVALFFIISGYVLGYRLLILIRRREFERLLDALASSTFRRYLRLYLSSSIGIILTFPLVRYRWYNGMIVPLYKNGFREQLNDCIYDAIRFCNPFANGIQGWVGAGNFSPKYLGVLWTIPVEYRGSVALFVFCLAACKLATRSRMVLLWALILICYFWQAVYISEFFAGLWIADYSLSRHPERIQGRGGREEAASNSGGDRITGATMLSLQPVPEAKYMARWQSDRSILLSKIGHVTLLVGGLILLGQPNHGDTLGIWGTFPWRFLISLYPSWWEESGHHVFWFGPGAFMVIYSLEFYPGTALRQPLHWPISQYIGDLSFGLYVVHSPLVLAVLWNLMHPLRHRYLGDTGYLAFLPGVLVTTLVCFTAADYFTRIDTKVVQFSRWLQRRLFAA